MHAWQTVEHIGRILTIFRTPGPAFWKTRRWSVDCIWECRVNRMYLRQPCQTQSLPRYTYMWYTEHAKKVSPRNFANAITECTIISQLYSSSHMRAINHNWSVTKQCLHLQSVAEISRHSVLSRDKIRQCETSSGSRHKDTSQCL